MNTLDRVVLYGGVGLAAILAAWGLSDLSDIGQRLHGQQHKMAAGAIPISVPAAAAGKCMVGNGYFELNYPAAGTVVQWQSRSKQQYYVVFKAGQDPFGSAGDIISVPADGTVSTAKSVTAQADNDCNSFQECVYPYTITTDAAGTTSCLAGNDAGSTYGVIIKPGG
jgi:hypothetical protein